jgi:dipeptidyl aminopeptidase/acylaminoacyl peptidase
MFSGFSCNPKASDNACSEEEFMFSGFDNVTLHGTLSVPSNYNANKKVVILVSPPSPSDRNYSGFFKRLADSLCQTGIAVLGFDNRSLIYKNTVHANDVDMFDQASDVHCAIDAIQNDRRFANAKIGLLGHSEGGCSVAIEASRNKRVSFIIVLSTIGIKGGDLTYYQMTKTLKPLLDSLTDQRRLIFSDWKKSIAIVSSNISIDSMNFLLKKKMVERSVNHPGLMGTNSLEKHFYQDSLNWLNRHRVAYIQYNPMLYYSKITCPVLAICGDADELIDYESNLNGIKTIFTSVNKENYTIKALKNVDHEYKRRNHSKYDLPFMDRAPNKSDSSSGNRKPTKYKTSKEMLDIVSAWIMRN